MRANMGIAVALGCAVLCAGAACGDEVVKRHHFVERTARAPVLDGKLDDACWQSAVPITDFGLSTSGGVRAKDYAIPPMEVRLLWDDEYLYIAAKSWEDTEWNVESHRTEAMSAANVFFDRDAIEVGVDGKNDEYTKHMLWLNALGERVMYWEYDFGYGMMTDTEYGKAADWEQAYANGRDAKGWFWVIEAKVALCDLEIRPEEGYMFGFEPSRFRWRKRRYDAAGKLVAEPASGYHASLEVLSWGTQGDWHKRVPMFGKCILVGKRPADAAAADALYAKAAAEGARRRKPQEDVAKPIDLANASEDGPDTRSWSDPTLVAWAKPAAGGHRKVLVTVNVGDGFAVQHLRNRLDVDADVVTVRYNFDEKKPNAALVRRLEKAMANDYDGYVFYAAGVSAWPERFRTRLRELNAAGKPVVFISSGCSWAKKFEPVKGFASAAPGPLRRLVSVNSRIRGGRPENVAVGGSPYELVTKDEWLSEPKAGTNGLGRITTWEFPHEESSTYIVSALANPSWSATPDNAYQDEYCLAYSARVVMEGLGLRGPARVAALTAAPAALGEAVSATLAAATDAPWRGQVRWRVRDNWGREVASAAVERVSLPAGGGTLTRTFPALPFGRYGVEAQLLDEKGAVCDFGACYAEVKAPAGSPSLGDVKLARKCFEKDEAAEATVAVKGVAKGLKVVAELRDPRLRIIGRKTLPVGPDGLVAISFPADRMRLNCHFLLVSLVNANGEKIDAASDWFFRRIGDIEDIRVFDMTSNHGGKDLVPRLALLEWGGMSVLQQGSPARLFYGNDPAIRNRQPGNVGYFGGSLNSPAYRRWLKRTFRRHAEDLRKANGRFISLGDDSANPTKFENTRCDWVDGFFRRLRARYEAWRATEQAAGRNPRLQNYLKRLGPKVMTHGWGDFYWGFQKDFERDAGLLALLASELDARDLDDIREAIREAYDDIRVFNLQNGVSVRSFDDLDDATLKALKPTSQPEFAYFLVWLEKKYGTVGKLNAAWGSDETDILAIREETIERLKREGKLTAEIDKLTFLEDSFVDTFGTIADAVKAVDPDILVGFGASHLKNTVADALKRIDAVIPYGRTGATVEDTELGRSFGCAGLGETIGWYGTSYGSDETRVPRQVRERQVWHGLLTGCNFWWLWTSCCGVTGSRTINPGGYGYFLDAFHEIRQGASALVRRAHREDDGVRILFSRISGLIAAVRTDGIVHPSSRNAWGQAVEGLQLQYVHVTDTDVAAGRLLTDGAKVVILPAVDVVDPRTAQALKEFVARGGAVIADVRPGTYDATGRKLEKGTLDDLFASSPRCTVLDENIGVHVARRGRASSDALRDRLLKLLAEAGVRPQIRVVGTDGKPARGVEVTRFTRGGVTVFGVEKEMFATESYPLAAKVVLPADAVVYDLRRNAKVGRCREFPVSFAGTDEFLFAALPYEVKGMRLDFQKPVRGGTLELTAALEGVTGTAETHVFRVEFVPREGFSQQRLPPIPNFLEDAPGGVMKLRVPMAFDEQGGLTVRVTDVMTGASASRPLEF